MSQKKRQGERDERRAGLGALNDALIIWVVNASALLMVKIFSQANQYLR